MTKVGLIGAGKMGISHLSILGAHPDVEISGVVDTSKLVTEVLNKYSDFYCFDDYKEMIRKTDPEAVFVATPTKSHAHIVKELLLNDIHVFVEKPFCLNTEEGRELVKIAKERGLVNQVGYHNKFIGTFSEAKKIITEGYIGNIHHFSADMNGPVVIQKKEITWRSKPDEGGGCLMDYAAHIIDLVNDVIAPIENVKSAILKSYYSNQVEDSVYALLETENKISGVLNVNWSDETYRKMSTSLTIIGSKGKINVDSTELKVFFKDNRTPNDYSKGWNIKHINELTEDVDFYLRGEEYSAQIDYFIGAIEGRFKNVKNTFENALKTDQVIEKIKTFKILNYA